MWDLLGFRRKPPVRQTYANVLAELDPEQLETVLLEFVERCGASESPSVSPATTSLSEILCQWVGRGGTLGVKEGF